MQYCTVPGTRYPVRVTGRILKLHMRNDTEHSRVTALPQICDVLSQIAIILQESCEQGFLFFRKVSESFLTLSEPALRMFAICEADRLANCESHRKVATTSQFVNCNCDTYLLYHILGPTRSPKDETKTHVCACRPKISRRHA